MSSSHPQMPPGFQAANIHPPPPPNFDQEQAYWQPRLDVINNILAGIPSVRHEDLTEAQARTESFALANIDQYIKEMNDKRAPGSDFYQAKFLHLGALLARSYQARKDWLDKAETAYNRVLVRYGVGDAIREMGQELHSLHQGLDAMNPVAQAEEEVNADDDENLGARWMVDATRQPDEDEDPTEFGIRGRGNHIDTTGDETSEASMWMDQYDAERS